MDWSYVYACIGALAFSRAGLFSPVCAGNGQRSHLARSPGARQFSLPHLLPSSHRPFPTPSALHKILYFFFLFLFLLATVRIISYLDSHTHRLLDLVSSGNDYHHHPPYAPSVTVSYSEHPDVSCIPSMTLLSPNFGAHLIIRTGGLRVGLQSHCSNPYLIPYHQ